MRILGLDFGTRTVGVAVSDALGLTAQGVEIIRRKSPDKLRQTLARIEALAASYDADKIVLGYPKHMNNTEGERCEKTMEFKEMLERRTNLPVELWDERLTTVAAENIMKESGIRRENRKEYVDEIAAMLILQGYLDACRENRKIKKGIKDMEKILFTDPDSQESVEFYCLEQTQINNQNYLLVTEDAKGDSEAYILKETSFDGEETVYEMVEEDAELEAIGRVFSELIEDVDLEY